MTKPQLLFDSNAIYRLIRETPEKALDNLTKGMTIYLAYYELGNALWRECLLLKRISVEEAEKSLDLMYSMLERMQVASLGSETGKQVLQSAHKFNLTFYDSAYLVEAERSGRTLVTDDSKLTKAAEKLGVKALPSKNLM
jgi:predicted nucleic acid-binding protein